MIIERCTKQVLRMVKLNTSKIMPVWGWGGGVSFAHSPQLIPFEHIWISEGLHIFGSVKVYTYLDQ